MSGGSMTAADRGAGTVDGMAVAVTADVHGNRWALEAVLADARVRGVDLLIDLGDLVYGPLDPGGTVETLRNAGLPLARVLGNEDRVVFEIDGFDSNHPSLQHTRANLTPDQLKWLRGARREVIWNSALLLHGRPKHDDQYLLHVVEPNGLRAAAATEVRAALGGLEVPLVLCGHSHLPGVVALGDEMTVVNPGSVGLQAYRDSSPWPHVVANGDPLARYARLVRSGGRWVPTLHAVEYDWPAAAREARRNGRPDWGLALERGFV